MISRIRVRWMLSLGLALALFLAAGATRDCWLEAIAQSLVSSGSVDRSEIILIENLEDDYLPFERAAKLRQAGFGRRIIVPVPSKTGPEECVALRIAEVMCEVAGITDPELVTVTLQEPYSIGMARQLAIKLHSEKVRSVIVTTSGFRSRRTYLIYNSVLSPLGIHLSCSPVFDETRPHNWTRTWHGVQGVVEQLLKLNYYRWVVL